VRGYLAGFPMVDFRVTRVRRLVHDVDSNELSFKMAGRLAVQDRMIGRAPPSSRPSRWNVEVYAPVRFCRRSDGRM